MSAGAMTRALALAACCMAILLPGPAPAAPEGDATRNGREIYQDFREGLSGPACSATVSERWRKHYAAAPKRLTSPDSQTLALFGYVLDAVHAASLPSEYALIPFVESGYKPDARSPSGPAGLWQMIKRTARSHDVEIRAGYDGRLSPVDSTRAAVRYLKTLHGMFAGDWRLAAMAYNAGEYRVLGALRSGGQVARDARPAELDLPGITRAYTRKLRAIACLLDEAGREPQWLQALDRPVPRLAPAEVPATFSSLDQWAEASGRDPDRVGQLNPVFTGGRINHGSGPALALAPTRAPGAAPVDGKTAAVGADTAPGSATSGP